MDRVELSEMTAEQLAANFAALTLAEAEARSAHDAAKSQQLREELGDLETALSERGEDGLEALRLLVGHSEEAVRLEAVAATLRQITGVKIGTQYIRMMAKGTNAPFLDEREPSSLPVPAMEPDELQTMSLLELVKRFMALAIEYDEEESPPDNDRLYWQLDYVRGEFRKRDGEAWRVLLPFYLDCDIRIRQAAADATREYLPELALDRLSALDDEEWCPSDDYAGLFEPAVLVGRTRKPSKLKSMTVDQLVERFVDLALDEEEADAMFQIAKANRVFGLKHAVLDELDSRDGDQRRALCRLFDHPSLQVRLNAARATLELVREDAEPVLQAIADSGEYPQAASAREALAPRNRSHGPC